MISWLAANAGNLLVGGVLLAVLAAIVTGILRDKKQGKSCCGGDCSRCRGCH